MQTFLLGAIGTYGPLKDLRPIGPRYKLRSGRRIDVLCEEVRHDGRGKLVAVELNKLADEGAAEQIVSYVAPWNTSRSGRAGLACAALSLPCPRRRWPNADEGAPGS